MMRVVLGIADAMVSEAVLPDYEVRSEFMFHPIREASLDELDCTFKRYLGCGRDQQVKMARHQDEFVQREFRFVAISKAGIDKEFRKLPRTED